ncbi:MAG: M48 family metallopeptidase [Microcoleus sp. PH2017_10_PVI_O_A]|uniref:M48 family metallopeptidase n=1 Tax=unclassified Microcoleus TaxID=2642155 RepID=UPI001DE51553|nr:MULTISPECIES: M48 family metallopeptidase [unclassified Microcoleus]TAE82208.1 MAG: M48 family peptidase [Oscillatoriales cyanobacterium]MCC3406458.1 M48 family metallopeptidase [Microcoleus sp. PH2017_10_PVI_O_A]MCC3459085.1 M48 family metallopeptidase [Microcoleus sp. PH2017_11_PCY_U_A]MCC3478963.1 M48 family metallopeptidase [Microcoleus sp. PH2017_12_PCY_D_A]MCC3529228.1 M48 family metallopeptidase [Microcoleus sp. PH2017_21_RUC_O_A]
MSNIPLRGLKADQFRHPLDLEATNALKQLPGLDLMVRQLLGQLGEQFFMLENLASSVQVGENQLPHLHQLLVDACKTLDLEVPQLYVRQHPMPNAYTFAMRGKQPFVVMHTSLIDLLTDEEVKAVIAHELGHLKCEHGVYLTLANLIVLAAGQISPLGTILAQGLQAQMLEWLRCAEFTCDRAALLATQDPRVVASVLMKLAGGSPTLAPKLNLDAFLAQARAYDDLSSTELGEMLKQAQTAQLSHPVPVLRAKEIDRWASSKNYESLLAESRSVCYDSETTKKGGWRNW